MDTELTDRAWHFVGSTLKDGRPVPPDGEWLVHDGPIVICNSGLHASRRPHDALQYAPGDTLCLVDVAGVVAEDADKLVCRRRRIVARMDATEILKYYARMQALSVIHLWDAPDVVLDYLMTGDESLRAASWAASWAASRAASEASWAASRAASRAASWASWASEASWAASEASWAASRAASRASEASEAADFDTLVYECFEGVL